MHSLGHPFQLHNPCAVLSTHKQPFVVWPFFEATEPVSTIYSDILFQLLTT